jgi:site-specific DNA-methyltransferase (adenine-specific)
MNPIRDEWQSEDGAVRLILGDCLDVLPTLDAGSVDAVCIDPPYCSGGRQQAQARGIISKANGDNRPDDAWIPTDNMGTDSYLWFCRMVGSACLLVASSGSQAFVFTDWRIYTVVVTAWESAGWSLKSVVVWDKARGGAMGSFWRNNHEWVCVFVKGKPRPIAHGSCFNTWTGTKPQDGEHPTEKPVELVEYLLNATGDRNGVVDCFMGSGTTGVACVRTGRRFVGIEIERKYWEIAVRRVRAELERFPLFEQASRPRQLELLDAGDVSVPVDSPA